MKNLVLAIALVIIASMTTGCASTSTFTTASCDQSMTVPALKVVGVAGAPASVLKGNIKAVGVDVPKSTEVLAIREAIKEQGLDYLVIVKVDEKNDYRSDKAASAKKVGLFALSLVASAITRNAVNLNNNSSSSVIAIKIVTTSISLYGSDGNLIRTKTTEKVMDASEAIPTTEVVTDSLSRCMSQG